MRNNGPGNPNRPTSGNLPRNGQPNNGQPNNGQLNGDAYSPLVYAIMADIASRGVDPSTLDPNRLRGGVQVVEQAMNSQMVRNDARRYRAVLVARASTAFEAGRLTAEQIQGVFNAACRRIETRNCPTTYDELLDALNELNMDRVDTSELLAGIRVIDPDYQG